MAYDSGVTVADIRQELGTFDDTAVPDPVIAQQIEHAEVRVDARASPSASDAQKIMAVTVIAAHRTLANNENAFLKVVEQGSASLNFDVETKADELAERASTALTLVTRDTARYVRTASSDTDDVEGAEEAR